MNEAKLARKKVFYSELRKLIDNQNYAKAIKTCNKILADNEVDTKAWQCKLAALINLGSFEEGINALKKCKVIDELLFEKAYCEYRTNDIKNAVESISKAKPCNKVKELKAQILYRLGRFDESYSIYKDLIKNVSDSYDQERLTNLMAVSVNRLYEDPKEKFPEVATDTYEKLYNKACGLIATGSYSEAIKVLEVVETKCSKLLTSEGASEEEIADETSMIRTQRSYCMQMLRKEKEALSLYNSILQSKPEDQTVLAVINNNIAAINKDMNIFDSKKKMKAAQAPNLEHKLLSRQRGAFALNQCILSYNTNQDQQCRQEIEQIKSEFPSYMLQATIIEAAIMMRGNKRNEAVDMLRNYARENTDNSLIVILNAVQLLLTQGLLEESLSILMYLRDEDKFKYGILSFILSLYSKLNKVTEASQLLKSAVEWYKNSKSSMEKFSVICQRSAEFHLKNGDAKCAAESLEEIRKLNPSDARIIAQLISAYSQFNREKANELSSQLPDAESIVSDYDVDNLVMCVEQKYGRKIAAKGTDGTVTSPIQGKSSATEAKKSKKKKKRKKILPKNYVAGVEQDPERWLPRWQRQGFKKKRGDKKKKENVGKGTQGGSSESADKFDITKNPGHFKSQPSSVGQSEWSKRNLKGKRGKRKK